MKKTKKQPKGQPQVGTTAVLADERPTWIPWVPQCYTDPQSCKVGDVLMDGCRPTCSIREIPIGRSKPMLTMEEIMNSISKERRLMRFRPIRLHKAADRACRQCYMLPDIGAGGNELRCSGACPDAWAWIRVS